MKLTKIILTALILLSFVSGCKKCVECSLMKPDGTVEYRNYECGKAHVEDVKGDCEFDAEFLSNTTGGNYTCLCNNR